ncbi:MAG: transposase [Bacteroidales bacterium]
MKQEKFEAGQIYHIYNRGNNKEDLFHEDKHYYYFLNLVKKYLVPVSDIYAYCLLKNHFHILLKIYDYEKLPEELINKMHLPFSNLFNSYTKSINKERNRTGSLFQEHIHKNKVNNDTYLKQLVLYIHMNPVKHFNTDFKIYPYSSYNTFLADRKTNISRDFILSYFEDRNNFEYWHNINKIKYEGLIEDIDKFDI